MTQSERIFVAFHELHKIRMLFMDRSETSLPPGEFMLLDQLFTLGRCRGCAEVNVSDLKGRRHMSLPAVSQTLGALERKGLLTRHMSANDRRRISVSITPEGEAAVERARSSIERTMGEVIARLGPDDARQLTELLERLSHVVAEMAQEKTGEVSES